MWIYLLEPYLWKAASRQMGTVVVAIAKPHVPGTLVNLAAGGGGLLNHIRTPVWCTKSWCYCQSLAKKVGLLEKAVMSRSARIIMEGFVLCSFDTFRVSL